MINKFKSLVCLLFVCFIILSLLVACSSNQTLTASALSTQENNAYQYGQFVWHDLLTPDIETAQAFYSEVFGWRYRFIEANPDAVVIVNRGRVIGNMLLHFEATAAGKDAVWLSSVSVADVEQSVKRVLRLGGEVIEGPSQLINRGQYAIVADNQGAAFILLHSQQGDPVDIKPGNGDWLWLELWTSNLKKAAYFYKKLLTYTVTKEAGQQSKYQIFKQENAKRAGMLPIPDSGIKPNWLPYIRVKDLERTLDKINQSGGRQLIGPDPKLTRHQIAIVADPTGAVFAIQELDLE